LALTLIGGMRPAEAQTPVDCTGTGSPAALQNLMPTWQGGSITIDGTCLGNITLYYPTGFYPGPSGGTIQGQIEVYGTLMFCGSGVVLEGDGTNSVVLWVHDSSTLLIQGCPIQNGGNDGIYAERGAIVDFGGPGNSIVNNGNHGIEASDGVTIRLGAIVPNPGGTPDPTQAVTISGNAADGIHMSGTANLHAYDASITGNGQNALFLSDASSARFTGGTITAPTSGTMPWAIQVHGASSLRLDSVDETLGGAAAAPNGIILASTNSSVTVYETTLTQNSGSTNPAIQASGAASVTIENANVTGAGNGALSLGANSSATLYGSIISDNGSGSGCGNLKPVINAAGGSTINLAGGNTIRNTVNSFALNVQNASTLFQGGATTLLPGAGFSNAVDTVDGSACIKTYSNMELGATKDTGSGLEWNGPGLIITVQQTSLARLDGNNLTINGELLFDQGADGYFNQNNWSGSGSANSVSSVVCNNVESRITNPGEVSPAVATGAPPGCTTF